MLKHLTNFEKKLLSCLIIILELYLRLYTKKYVESLEILTPKQMLPRLPITLAQVKAGSTYQILFNEIR